MTSFYQTHESIPSVGGYVARGRFIPPAETAAGVVLFNQDLAGPHVEVNMGERGHLNLTTEMAVDLHAALARVLPPAQKMAPEIQLGSGRYFNFIEPGMYGLLPEDIAHGLARQSRFSGHTRADTPIYTIAQHCVLASYAVESGFEYEALMHDASEAVTGDCASPLKQLLREWKLLETHIESWLADEYGLPWPMSPQVKQIDLRLLRTEKRDLMPHGYDGEEEDVWAFTAGVVPLPAPIDDIWPTSVAAIAWLRRFRQLAPAYIQARQRLRRDHIMVRGEPAPAPCPAAVFNAAYHFNAGVVG